jgi:hypothetical protein
VPFVAGGAKKATAKHRSQGKRDETGNQDRNADGNGKFMQ